MHLDIRSLFNEAFDDNKNENSQGYRFKYHRTFALYMTLFLALIPVLIDNISSEKTYSCPARNYKSYSLLLLLAPTMSVILVGGCYTLYNLLVGFKRLSIQRKVRKVFFRIGIILILSVACLGFNLIISSYYVCYSIGPQHNSGLEDLDLDYQKKSREIRVESQKLGWLIVLSTLLFTTILSLINVTILRPSESELFEKRIRVEIVKNVQTEVNNSIKSLASRVSTLLTHEWNKKMVKLCSNGNTDVKEIFEGYKDIEYCLNDNMKIKNIIEYFGNVKEFPHGCV